MRPFVLSAVFIYEFIKLKYREWIVMVQNSGGCCGPGCCSEIKDIQKQIIIDFLYLDLNVCNPCRGTDSSLDEAVSEVAKVLQATGVDVVVNKIQVHSEEMARAWKFVSSPTIRINGRDIQMEVKESLCESCGELCGDDVDCRVWVYQGKDYTVPPKAMIIEAILKEVYGGVHHTSNTTEQEYVMPDNLKRFYAALQNKQSGKTDSATLQSVNDGCCGSSGPPNKLKIEWKHLDVAGDTCNRCYDTGENLYNEVKRLNRSLQPRGIEVEFIETKLDDTQIPQSNVLLFNGVPIEEVLDIKVAENYCESCTDLLGTDTYCRTIIYEGNEYEDIPAKAIREAALKVLGLTKKTTAPIVDPGCGCKDSKCC